MKLAVLASLLALLLAARYCEAAVTRRLSASRREATGEELEDRSALDSDADDTGQHKPARERRSHRSHAAAVSEPKVDAAAEPSDPGSDNLEEEAGSSGGAHKLSLAARQHANHGTDDPMNDAKLDSEDTKAASERGSASHVPDSAKPTQAKVQSSHKKHGKGLAVVKAGGGTADSKLKITIDSMKDASESPEDFGENGIKDMKPASAMHAVRATKTKNKSGSKTVSMEDEPSDSEDGVTTGITKDTDETQDASRESEHKKARQNHKEGEGDSADFKNTVASGSAENTGESQDDSGDDTVKHVEPAAPTLALNAVKKQKSKGTRAKQVEDDSSDADAGAASNADPHEDVALEKTDAPRPQMDRPQPAVAMHVGQRAKGARVDSSDADADAASNADPHEDVASEETDAPRPQMDRPQPAVAMHVGRGTEEVEDDSSAADAGASSNADPHEDVASEETDAPRPQIDRPQPAVAMRVGRKRNANRAISGGSYEAGDPSVIARDGDSGDYKVGDDYNLNDEALGARTSRGNSVSAEDGADSGRATSSDEFQDGANADDPSAPRRSTEGSAYTLAMHGGSEDDSDDTSRAEDGAAGTESVDSQEGPTAGSGSSLDPSAEASSESSIEAPEALGVDEGRGDASSAEDVSFSAPRHRQRPVHHRMSLSRMDSVVFRGRHRRHAAAAERERERLSEEATEGANSGDEVQEGAGDTESVGDVADRLEGQEEGDDNAAEEEDTGSQEPIVQDQDQVVDNDLREDDAVDDQASATDQALMLAGASSDMVEGADTGDGEATDEEAEEPTVRDDDGNMVEEGSYPSEGDGDE